jgi:DNA-binding HxlR family transcriptional regulator
MVRYGVAQMEDEVNRFESITQKLPELRSSTLNSQLLARHPRGFVAHPQI